VDRVNQVGAGRRAGDSGQDVGAWSRAIAVPLLALLVLVETGCAAKRGFETRELPPPPEELLPGVEVRGLTLGPGDEVEVFVWGEPDLTARAKVTGAGLLPYPLIGPLRASGLTPEQVRDEVTRGLREYLTDPKVSVNVIAIKLQKVFVFGEVQRPGVYALDSFGPTTVVDAIGQAGGVTPDAKRSELLLVRGDTADRNRVYIRPFDLDAVLGSGDLRENPTLVAGDIVYVPPRTMATVAREARRITDILLPFLLAANLLVDVQTLTIRWGEFTDALTGKKAEDSGRTIVILPPAGGGGVVVSPERPGSAP